MAKRRKKKRNYIVGKPLLNPAPIELKYGNAIKVNVEKMTAKIRKDVFELFNRDYAQEHFAALGQPVGTMDSENTGSQIRILMNRLKSNYDQLFGRLAMGLSPWMANSVNRSSATQVSTSVVDMPNLRSEGRTLTLDIRKLDEATKTILKTSAARSTNFIKSIPDRYINTVTNEVY